MPDGSICCTNCYSQPQAQAQSQPQSQPPPQAAAAPTPSVSAFQGPATSAQQRGCPQHPALPPVAFCKVCGKGSCVTCDFFFPPNIHLCPVCVTSAHSKLTPMRKKYLITAFCTAGFSSLGVIATLGGAFASMAQDPMMEWVIGLIIIAVVTVPSAIGTGVAWAALKPGGPNPISVWIAMVWNVLLLCTMLLLMIIGNIMN